MASANGSFRTERGIDTHAARIIIRGNPEGLQDVPEPPATMHGLPCEGTSSVRRLHDIGVLERVERCQDDHPDCENEYPQKCDTWLWRATRQGYEVIREELAERPTLDCGHPPFSNLRGVDGYSCTNPDCDARYSREEVREVMQ